MNPRDRIMRNNVFENCVVVGNNVRMKKKAKKGTVLGYLSGMYVTKGVS